MPLNKQTGNMYAFVTHTWNPIRGKCPHDCSYCYMRGFNVGELRFVKKEMSTNLGEGNFIFVGSSTDMWADAIPFEWLVLVVRNCYGYKNRYLFQSKNPSRFLEFEYPNDMNVILGTTIETNRDNQVSKAPSFLYRYAAMVELRDLGIPQMVSIEPIMDFDLDAMVETIKLLCPEFVSIGADSKRHNLPEPSREKTTKLIEELQGITTVKVKSNLTRLLNP